MPADERAYECQTCLDPVVLHQLRRCNGCVHATFCDRCITRGYDASTGGHQGNAMSKCPTCRADYHGVAFDRDGLIGNNVELNADRLTVRVWKTDLLKRYDAYLNPPANAGRGRGGKVLHRLGFGMLDADAVEFLTDQDRAKAEKKRASILEMLEVERNRRDCEVCRLGRAHTKEDLWKHAVHPGLKLPTPDKPAP